MRRREFLGASVAFASAGAPTSELEEASLADIGEGLAKGRWTSRRLVEQYFARMDAIDRAGPMLRAVIERNPEAEAIADRLDRERKSGHTRGPLHGVPVLIKDNIDTADKMSTSAGSLALAGWHAAKDAPLVQRLRDAGAVLLGKTNLSEWANFRSTHSVSGWSGRGGQTRNPYALHRNPSGSSSGSGVSVSASLCAAGVGTETDGSIISPAAVNGIVGVKPTVGLISGSGIIPIAHSQDTAGPMARTVRDAALLLTVLASKGEDYAKSLDANGLKGARIGVARKFFEKTPLMDRFLNRCVDVLKKSGAEVIEGTDLPGYGKWNDPEFEVLLYEFKADLNQYLAKANKTLADLIAFNETQRDSELKYFEQEIFLQAEAKGPLTEKKYLDARADCIRLTRAEGIDAVCEKYKLDAIVSLSSGPAWLIDWVNGDTDTGGCTSPAAIAGYPHITVPAGFFRDLPIGLSFFGKAWSETVLFRLAYAFEQATKARRKPQYLRGTEEARG